MKYSTDNTPTIYFYALPWKLKRNSRKKRGQLDYWKDFFLFIYIIGMSGFTQVSYELNDHGSSHIFTFLFLFFVVIFVCFFNQFCYVSYHINYSVLNKSPSPLSLVNNTCIQAKTVFILMTKYYYSYMYAEMTSTTSPLPPPPKAARRRVRWWHFRQAYTMCIGNLIQHSRIHLTWWSLTCQK